MFNVAHQAKKYNFYIIIIIIPFFLNAMVLMRATLYSQSSQVEHENFLFSPKRSECSGDLRRELVYNAFSLHLLQKIPPYNASTFRSIPGNKGGWKRLSVVDSPPWSSRKSKSTHKHYCMQLGPKLPCCERLVCWMWNNPSLDCNI